MVLTILVISGAGALTLRYLSRARFVTAVYVYISDQYCDIYLKYYAFFYSAVKNNYL